MATDYPKPDPRKVLENERRRTARLAEESAEVLAYHDERRKGFEATHTLYQTRLAELDEQLAQPA